MPQSNKNNNTYVSTFSKPTTMPKISFHFSINIPVKVYTYPYPDTPDINDLSLEEIQRIVQMYRKHKAPEYSQQDTEEV